MNRAVDDGRTGDFQPQGTAAPTIRRPARTKLRRREPAAAQFRRIAARAAVHALVAARRTLSRAIPLRRHVDRRGFAERKRAADRHTETIARLRLVGKMRPLAAVDRAVPRHREDRKRALLGIRRCESDRSHVVDRLLPGRDRIGKIIDARIPDEICGRERRKKNLIVAGRQFLLIPVRRRRGLVIYAPHPHAGIAWNREVVNRHAHGRSRGRVKSRLERDVKRRILLSRSVHDRLNEDFSRDRPFGNRHRSRRRRIVRPFDGRHPRKGIVDGQRRTGLRTRHRHNTRHRVALLRIRRQCKTERTIVEGGRNGFFVRTRIVRRHNLHRIGRTIDKIREIEGEVLFRRHSTVIDRLHRIAAAVNGNCLHRRSLRALRQLRRHAIRAFNRPRHAGGGNRRRLF